MKTYRRFRITGLVTLLPLTLSAQVTWTGGGVLDTDWATAGNWSSNPAVPTDSNNVIIDGGPATITTLDAVAGTLTIASTNLTSGEFAVAAGGVLSVSTKSILGAGADSAGFATVSGAGATWNSAALVIGEFGDGTLIISDGGVVNSSSADLAIGHVDAANVTQGTVLVTGSGSAWNVAGTFAIGGYSNETTYHEATLTLVDGGSVTVGAGGTGTLTLNNNGVIQIGDADVAGVAGTLTAGEIVFDDSGYIDADTTPSADIPTLAFNHTDAVEFTAKLSGVGLVTKAGSGTLTLTADGVADILDATSFSGDIEVSGGTLVLDAGGYWDGNADFTVRGADTTLRIATGTTLANDIHVTDGTVEIAGVIDYGFVGNTFTDATLRVLSGGIITGGQFTFNGTATLQATNADAITGGEFVFTGNRTINLPVPGVITGGLIVLKDNVATELDQAGMLSAFHDEDLDEYSYLALNAADTAHITVSATGAVQNSSVTLLGTATLDLDASGGLLDSELTLIGGVAVTLGADQALENTFVTMIADPANPLLVPEINLDGRDVTFAAIDALAGRIINDNPTAVTVTISDEYCGCGYPSLFLGTFVEDPNGTIGVSVVGGANLLIGVTQTYTGPTLVDYAGLFVISSPDADYNPVPGVLTTTSITLRNGATLGGDGTVDDVTIFDGGTLVPGYNQFTPVGTFTANSITFVNNLALAEASYLAFTIYDADPLLGPGVGTDYLNVTDTLTFSPDPLDTYTVRIRSLGDTADNLTLNFDAGASQSWQITSAMGGIFNFDASRFIVDATLFKNATGLWTVTLGLGNTAIYLNYAPIPEPGTFALLGSLGVLPVLLLRRRRRD